MKGLMVLVCMLFGSTYAFAQPPTPWPSPATQTFAQNGAGLPCGRNQFSGSKDPNCPQPTQSPAPTPAPLPCAAEQAAFDQALAAVNYALKVLSEDQYEISDDEQDDQNAIDIDSGWVDREGRRLNAVQKRITNLQEASSRLETGESASEVINGQIYTRGPPDSVLLSSLITNDQKQATELQSSIDQSNSALAKDEQRLKDDQGRMQALVDKVNQAEQQYGAAQQALAKCEAAHAAGP